MFSPSVWQAVVVGVWLIGFHDCGVSRKVGKSLYSKLEAKLFGAIPDRVHALTRPHIRKSTGSLAEGYPVPSAGCQTTPRKTCLFWVGHC
jgi:hypothetical protein